MRVNLVMFREPGGRRDFPLSNPVATIGRKEECDIRIPLTEVSRKHARITISENGAALEDLGSANGTYLNNQRIKQRSKLSPGDHIVVGPVVFTVQLDGEPQEIRAVKTKLRAVHAASGSGAGLVTGVSNQDSEFAEVDDPISALEALASSADQTAINPFEGEEDVTQ